MRFSIKDIANPYLIFSIIWSLALVIYLFGWSEIFPAISIGLLVFIVAAIILHFCFGVLIYKSKLVVYKPYNGLLAIRVMVFLNVFLWIVEFFYSKIPLIEIIRGTNYDYQDFGIPTVKVFITSFNAFLCLHVYHVYLSTGKKVYLRYYLLCVCFFALAFSRV